MIIIRKARKSDLKGIQENEIQFLKELSKNEKLLRMDDTGMKSSRISMTKTFKNKHWKFFIAEEKGRIIGHIFGKINKMQKIFAIDKIGFIEVLYVQPNYRGKNIGKQLVNKLESWFKSKDLQYSELDAREQIGGFWHKFDYKDLYKRMRKNL